MSTEPSANPSWKRTLPRLPFADVAGAALASVDAVLNRYLPGGKRQGHEYVARNPLRNDARAGSFSVNVDTGRWSDFATGDAGGDLVSLVAYLSGSNQGEAADELAQFFGMASPGDATARAPMRTVTRPDSDAVLMLPIPDDAPSTKGEHPKLGKPSTHWTYRDAQGRTLFHVCRFDPAEGRKQIVPLSLWRSASGLQWRWKGVPEPRPLYGLDRLALRPDVPVVVCEGEKATDAAQRLLPDCVCVTSPNGAASAHKADWSVFAGRTVAIWPDADSEGARYAQDVAKFAVAAGVQSVTLMDVATLADGPLPEGFDAADYERDGRDVALLRDVIRQARSLPDAADATATVATSATDACVPAGSVATVAGVAVADWSELLPLAAKIEPEPYPLDALPQTVRAAVEEVLRFTKAPVAMVASCALSALSLTLQAHADVKRAEKLTGPAGLFLLTIADSGDRKTTCDGFFTSAIRDYQEQQAEAAKPVMQEFRSALSAWEAKRSGIIEGIKTDAKGGKDATNKETLLRQLDECMPEAPRVPRLMFGDATPEALAFALAKNWPSGGVLSSEAGIVFGAHGMSKDSMMRNLALLNVLWDGGTLAIDRRGEGGTFTLRGARLTVALQIQEATLRSFFDRSGGLARGTGFLARFLVAWPESRQGYRPFTEPPAHWPALGIFNRRVAALLANPVPMDENGALNPPLLPLASDAKTAWIVFHDALEVELRIGGELYDVRDVASKCADNAVRLAGLFQQFEYGGGAIGLEAFEGGSRIAAWHLNEGRRFFGELAMPEPLANAARLESWLLAWCREKRTTLVPRRAIQNGGPSGLRHGDKLDEALRELISAGRVRWAVEGRRKNIEVRPGLVSADRRGMP